MARVSVEQGELEGLLCEVNNIKYVAFKGIPYAQPPLGDLRFKAPRPPRPWEGVREAKHHGPVCPQYNERMERIEEGSEDCLYLNVYTKDLSPTTPAPVLFWIHGGGFYTGSGNSDFYGPEYILEHDVILVTINYRLEVFGFLCLDTPEVPGNAGLKDQVAALRWVHDNIAAFGGDSSNVTIFGCSAGSASVSYHLLSPMSQGLFQKAICQSGVCLNEWSHNPYALRRAIQLGKFLGKDTEDADELLKFLRLQPPTSLVRIKLPKLESIPDDLANGILFGPVTEKCGPETEKFISKTPTELLKEGKIAKVPIILGYVSGEGMETAKYFMEAPEIRAHKLELSVPRELKSAWPVDKIKEAAEKIKLFYFGKRNIAKDTFQELVDLDTDFLFTFNIRRFARHAVRHTGMPVYLYKFDMATERNFTKNKYNMSSVKGVCHADELGYLFNVTCMNLPQTNESLKTTKELVSLWINFASTGYDTNLLY
ncbi:Venom carboxylesterase-6 [Eumeta japonica]|uniref:Carboxylic ester hydrolase n=1 Tax=Eumeta variegata TaxID=151549 RepID=A0A4C1XE68_EUMVA|nr:Venom carboxylesterase-6 [Eumeta japonica]